MKIITQRGIFTVVTHNAIEYLFQGNTPVGEYFKATGGMYLKTGHYSERKPLLDIIDQWYGKRLDVIIYPCTTYDSLDECINTIFYHD